jgi:metallo-beta-lactamase family protein
MGAHSIKFLGAAGTVTGSKFLLNFGDEYVLIEAGLFQGQKENRLKNWAEFPVDPSKISNVLISHSHLDHCGYLPRLVKAGFNGKILMTRNTASLVKIILEDSAQIQLEDAKYAQKKGYSRHERPLPLYEHGDVERTLKLFKANPYRADYEINSEVKVKFHPAGHILGSAFIEIDFYGKSLLFTGDFGRDNHPLLLKPDPAPKRKFDVVITESTYGDREHKDSGDLLQESINKTLARGGSVLIPAFAVDRTEVLLMKLKALMDEGKIPKVEIFLDSPMALTALKFYRDAVSNHSGEIRPEVFSKGDAVFDSGTLRESKTPEDSKKLNNPKNPCIIISASGMATGGRVVHHLKNMLPNAQNSVILVGYQAVGTRGASLEAGEPEIKMHGQMVPVNAEIFKIEGYSVHADTNELITWFKDLPEKPGQVFVVHGEENAASSFAKKLNEELTWPAVAPAHGQEFFF